MIHHHNLLAASILLNEALLPIYDLEELVEALNLAYGDLLEVDISRITENHGEEVLPLFVVEEEDLSLVLVMISSLSVLVYPL
jgi:hypothetical protein